MNSMNKVKVYKDSISTIVYNEKKELEQNYYIIQSLLKYISVIQETKDTSSKRFIKLIKLLKSKSDRHNYDLPLIELWECLIRKYEGIVKNNSLYNIFIENIKNKVEILINTFTNNSYLSYQDIASIFDKLNVQDTSFHSEDINSVAEEEIRHETENLIKTIDLVVTAVQDTFTHTKTFIKSLYASLSALVSYEGIYIEQSRELVKSIEEFINNFDIEHAKFKKNRELQEINQLMPEIFNEFDLLSTYENQEEDIKSIEGGHKLPYQTKKLSLNLSDNNSHKSNFSDDISNDTHQITENNIKPKEETKQDHLPNSGKTLSNDITKIEKSRSNPEASVLNDLERKSTLFHLEKFQDLKSDIFKEEQEYYNENTQEENKTTESNTSTFEKKFKLSKGEKLIDSFT